MATAVTIKTQTIAFRFMPSPTRPCYAASRVPSSAVRWLRAEPRLEAICTLATLQRIHRVGGSQNAQPDKLRTVFVPDVYRLRRRVLEIKPHLCDGMAGWTPHARRGVLLVPENALSDFRC